MKLPFILLVLSLIVGDALAQSDSADLQKSTVEYIRERKFREAALVMDLRSNDVFSFFCFEAAIPINGAYDGDTLFQQFFAFNGEAANKLSPFSNLIALTCRFHNRKKDRGTEELLAAVKASLSGEADLLTGYAAYIALRHLEPEIAYETYIALHTDLRAYLRNTRPAATDKTGSMLRSALLFNVAKELLFEKTGDPEHLLLLEFPLVSAGNSFVIPFMDNDDFFVPVFETKMDILKWYNTDRQQEFVLNALIDSPSKKHARAVRKLFPSREMYAGALQEQFNERAEAVFNERTWTFIGANRKPGQWTVVDIWGTWCSPCIEELPSWQEFHAKQYEKVNFVALSVGSKDAADFLAKNSYTFPAMDLMNDEVAALGLSFFPSTFLLSPEGKAMLLPMGGNKIGSIEVLTGGF